MIAMLLFPCVFGYPCGLQTTPVPPSTFEALFLIAILSTAVLAWVIIFGLFLLLIFCGKDQANGKNETRLIE